MTAAVLVRSNDEGLRSSIATVGDAGHGRPYKIYPGGKGAAGSAQQIAGRFPHHGLYVEPFLGNGAVLRAKRAALRSIGIDSDPEVIAGWRRCAWPGLQLVEGDGIAWLGDAGSQLPADALVYADPPYPMHTRTKRLYRHELTAADHRRLVEVLRGLSCSVFVSSYDNPLYRKAFAGWQHGSWRAMTRGGVRIEHLWYRAAPGGIANPGVAGRDFRERERIKRKVARWQAKFAQMSPHEREAILQALLESHAVGIHTRRK